MLLFFRYLRHLLGAQDVAFAADTGETAANATARSGTGRIREYPSLSHESARAARKGLIALVQPSAARQASIHLRFSIKRLTGLRSAGAGHRAGVGSHTGGRGADENGGRTRQAAFERNARQYGPDATSHPYRFTAARLAQGHAGSGSLSARFDPDGLRTAIDQAVMNVAQEAGDDPSSPRECDPKIAISLSMLTGNARMRWTRTPGVALRGRCA